MARKHARLALEERKSIEERLDKGTSINKTADVIGRSPSTVLREVLADKVEGRSPSSVLHETKV